MQLSDNLITFRYHYNNNLVTTLYNLESGSIINGYIKNEVFNSSYFPQTYSFKDGVLILHIDAINPYNENAVIFFSQDELKTLRDLKTNNRNAHIAIKFEYKNL